MKAEEIKLGAVQETLLLPLWGRACETRKAHPLLRDDKAVSIVESLPYDFSTFAAKVARTSQRAWIARSLYFDAKIKAFAAARPEATVVNVGCGLDTTFDRVDNGRLRWIDLDLPDTIELRRKFFTESDRREIVAGSVFDEAWYERLKGRRNVMLLFAGVLYYFDEAEIRKLFKTFHERLPGAELLFDYASPLGVRIANKKLLDETGMQPGARLKWGIKHIHAIEKWEGNLRVLNRRRMFHDFKHRFPLGQRLDMTLSDALKIMSLAHIRVG